MKEIQVQDDIDAHARLIGRALNYLRYLKDIREEAAGLGIHLMDEAWHDVPRDTFDAAGEGSSCEMTEWQGFRADGRTYWSKKIRGFYLYTAEAPSARSRQPEYVRTAGGAAVVPRPLVISDVCEDCGETRWRLAGDESGGSPLVKVCERCGKERPL